MRGSSRTVIRGLILLVLGLVSVMPWSSRVAAQGRATTADTRQRLRLTPAEANAVRAEMRQMLATVNGVLQGLATENLAAVEKAAATSGMAAAVDPHLEQKLPPQFVELGERTHRGFDELASAARARVAATDLMKRLADVTSNCIACHAIYRLDDTR